MHRGCLLWTLSAVALLALAGVGCEDDTTTTDDGGRDDAVRDDGAAGPDADADADADGDAETTTDEGGGGTGTLTVRVVRFESLVDEGIPVPDAAVALDKPGGERVEGTSDAEGRVAFEEIDWAAGRAAVTAWADGYALASRVGIVEPAEGEEAEIALLELEGPDDGVEVSGAVAHIANEADSITVTATDAYDFWQDTGPEWTIHVPPETPFAVVACEWHAGDDPVSPRGVSQFFEGWTMAEHDGVTEPATVALDFDPGLEAHAVHGSIPIVERADSPLRTGGTGYFMVASAPLDGAYLGFPTVLDIGADGNSYEYDGEYVELTGATEVVTGYCLYGGYGEYSCVIVEDYPTDGAQAVEFLDVPRMISPATPRERHPLHDPFEWEAFDEGVVQALFLLRGESIVWRVAVPEGVETATVPEPPSAVDAEALLGTGLLEAMLGFWTPAPEGQAYNDHYGGTGTFLVSR